MVLDTFFKDKANHYINSGWEGKQTCAARKAHEAHESGGQKSKYKCILFEEINRGDWVRDLGASKNNLFTRVLGHVLPAAAEKVNPKYFGRSKQHVERLKDTNFWIWLNDTYIHWPSADAVEEFKAYDNFTKKNLEDLLTDFPSQDVQGGGRRRGRRKTRKKKKRTRTKRKGGRRKKTRRKKRTRKK